MILLQAIDIWVGTHRRFSRASADLPLFAAVLDAMDLGAVSPYQPYWAVRAHLLQRLRNAREAADAYDRAIGLAEDPAVKEFLLQRRG